MLGVKLVPRSHFLGWNGDALRFASPEGETDYRTDAAIFALGGGSWPRLGSDASWTQAFADHGASIAPIAPSNCGFLANWSTIFRERFAGQPLKPARFTFGDEHIRGEAIITSGGIEGGAIYALSARLREAIARDGHADLVLDLAPHVSEEDLFRRLGGSNDMSMANRLRRAGLPPVSAGLLRERAGGPQLPSDPHDLAQLIKSLPLRLTGIADIARAISTAGGVTWDSLNPDFSLKSDPATFIAGEMLDWEAPTGGYLLQACFATGRTAAQGALARLA
jgi:uncharacterized flavoprotein (TIGR03862 family)